MSEIKLDEDRIILRQRRFGVVVFVLEGLRAGGAGGGFVNDVGGP